MVQMIRSAKEPLPLASGVPNTLTAPLPYRNIAVVDHQNQIIMKAIFSAMLLAGFLFSGPDLYAQDPMSLGKMYKKVLLENDRVRVMSVVFAPGDVMPWHSHPAHTVYAITGGKIEITAKDQAPVVMDITPGEVMYLEPVTHMAKNIGKTTMNLVVTELKR